MLNAESKQYRQLIPTLICLGLAMITIIAFWPVRGCGFINFDDSIYVYSNAYVQTDLSWNSISMAVGSELVVMSANWHPLTWLSLMLDYSIFGLDPFGYHLVNLLFHVMNTILLFLVLRRMTKKPWPSAFVAALFAIHPHHVESVAWVAERKDVLSTFFWMLTLGAYSYYIENRSFRRYVFVLLFFVMGLMSKSMLVTLPFVLLLLDYWPLQRFSEGPPDQNIQAEVLTSVIDQQKKKSRKNKTQQDTVKEILDIKKMASSEFKQRLIYPFLLEKVPLFVLALLSSIVAYCAQQKGGAVSSIDMLPLFVRIGNAFISYVTYIWKMILPINLAVFYPYPIKLIIWQVLGAICIFIAITVAVFGMAKRFPYLATGWFWYLGALVPVIGIVQAGSQAMADRYTYVPLIGLFIIVAWGVPDLLKKWNHRKEILYASSALILLILAIITSIQAGYWRDSITLYDHALKVTDGNWLIHNNRGAAYYDLGNYQQAIDDYNRAIEIKPKYAEASNNRGAAYHKLGDYRRAISEFDRAIEIKPGYEEAYNNRGTVFHILGSYREAIADFNKAIEIKPAYATAYNNLGNAYSALGDYRQAIKNYGRAITIKPKYADAYFNRGTACNSLGYYTEAISDLNKAIEIKPAYPEAYINKGFAHKGLSDYRQAIMDYSRAIEIKPDYAYAYLNRSAAHIHVGDNDLGLKDLKTAAKLGDEQARGILQRRGISW